MVWLSLTKVDSSILCILWSLRTRYSLTRETVKRIDENHHGTFRCEQEYVQCRRYNVWHSAIVCNPSVNRICNVGVCLQYFQLYLLPMRHYTKSILYRLSFILNTHVFSCYTKLDSNSTIANIAGGHSLYMLYSWFWKQLQKHAFHQWIVPIFVHL